MTELVKHEFKPVDRLIHAVRARDFALVKTLIRQHVNPDVRGSLGMCALHYVDYDKILKYLIKKGANIEVKDAEGCTPLFKSLKEMVMGRLNERERARKTFLLLLQHGANVNTVDSEGMTPLFFAYLVGRKSIANQLLAKGADTNVLKYSTDRDLAGKRLFAKAVNNGSVMAVKLLLDCGLDPNAGLEDGRTLLHATVYQTHYDRIDEGRAQIAELLLERGADPDERDRYDSTPLEMAKILRNERLITLLSPPG